MPDGVMYPTLTWRVPPGFPARGQFAMSRTPSPFAEWAVVAGGDEERCQLAVTLNNSHTRKAGHTKDSRNPPT